jgi:N-acetylglucosamine-6-phosphate deacetylase
VKRVTVAPDVKGITEFTKAASEHSIQVSAGHDNCIHPEVEACVKEGLSSVTHLFNCTSRAARRGGIEKYLGLTETALVREDLVAEIIGDGVHVPYGLIYLTYKNKGTKGMCIVSDSLAVSGINTSPLYLGKEGEGYLVELKEGVCCIAGTNTLAGSVTPISKMVENIVKNTSIPLVDCLVMSTLTPSRLLNMKDRGDVKVGYVADMNIVSPTGKIVNTIFKGRII